MNEPNKEDEVYWRGFDARLQRLEDMVYELDQILRGDRHRKIVGLLAEQDRMDADLRKLNAVVFQDSTGKRGLAHDIDILMERKQSKDQSRPYRWQFWTTVVAALIAAGTTILTNWDKILKALPKDKDPLHQMLERAKHPKSPKKIYRVRVLAPETSPSQDPQDQK